MNIKRKAGVTTERHPWDPEEAGLPLPRIGKPSRVSKSDSDALPSVPGKAHIGAQQVLCLSLASLWDKLVAGVFWKVI